MRVWMASTVHVSVAKTEPEQQYNSTLEEAVKITRLPDQSGPAPLRGFPSEWTEVCGFVKASQCSCGMAQTWCV